MLEHQKMVIKGVSEIKNLFKKEIIKSLAWLNRDDQSQLLKWLMQNFMQQHPDIINELVRPNYIAISK